MNISKKKLNIGLSIVEIIVASSLLLILAGTIFISFSLSLKSSLTNTPYIQAGFLLEEGNEALRNMRDWGWNDRIASLSNGVSYGLDYSTSWNATTSNYLIDGKFERTFVLYAVQRDASYNVVSSGGTVDPNIKRVVVSVSWVEKGATTTKTMESYVSNLFSN